MNNIVINTPFITNTEWIEFLNTLNDCDNTSLIKSFQLLTEQLSPRQINNITELKLDYLALDKAGIFESIEGYKFIDVRFTKPNTYIRVFESSVNIYNGVEDIPFGIFYNDDIVGAEYGFISNNFTRILDYFLGLSVKPDGFRTCDKLNLYTIENKVIMADRPLEALAIYDTIFNVGIFDEDNNFEASWLEKVNKVSWDNFNYAQPYSTRKDAEQYLRVNYDHGSWYESRIHKLLVQYEKHDSFTNDANGFPRFITGTFKTSNKSKTLQTLIGI